MPKFSRSMFLLAAIFLALKAWAAPPKYSAVDLGTIGGQTAPLAINDKGDVVGDSLVAGNPHAFLYSNGAIQDLGTLGGAQSFGLSVNHFRQVVGVANPTNSVITHAFLYSGGVMADLGLSTIFNSAAAGINNVGQITGLIDSGTAIHAFIYSGGNVIDLGTLGGSFSQGLSINDVGQVAGTSRITGDSFVHAFLYSGGQLSDLGTLGGNFSQAHGMNNHGHVVGSATTAGDLSSHVFLYANGGMTDLGALGISGTTTGWSINDVGQIVGESDGVAFLYDAGTMKDLNGLVSLNTTLLSSHGINNAGQIIALGADGHGYLLTPLPASDPIVITSVTGPVNPTPVGNAVVVVASFTDAALSNDTCTFAWGDGTSTSVPAGSGSCTASRVYPSAGVYAVGVTVTSGDGRSANATLQPVIVAVIDAVGPLTSGVSIAPSPLAINTGSLLSASVSDFTTGGSNIASAYYSLNAGTPSQMTLTPSTAVTTQASVTLPPIAQSNVYNVCVHGTDSAGNTGADACILLPVYDPNGSFVTGGGQVASPAGADLLNAPAVGQASFGFVSKYLPGRNTPSGNLQFQFQEGNLNFTSTSMDWLVVTGEPRAKFHGTGTVNGTYVCNFEVDAWAGSFAGHVDAFGLKITSCSNGADRYNLPARPLTGGNIIIHK